ncbi:MAG: xanthine dehydrogenase family protein subunit M [Thermoprotei archaeon]|nr:MAG: xanthine dehydrogenase family protein subunit M [Thermoprotei archaeon]
MVIFYLIPEINYLRPKTKEECLKLINELRDFKVLAGGTDLVVDLKIGRFRVRNLVDISRLPELRFIKDEGSQLRIGACVTLQELLESKVVKEKLPVLYEAIDSMASWQIRNLATIGGNLCNASPAADTAPPLYVLNAKLVLESVDGVRVINVEDFFLGPRKTVLKPNEILTEILIPYPQGRVGMRFIKLGRRTSFTLSVVAVAALVSVEGRVFKDVRIALNSVAPTPVRARSVESRLVGKEVSLSNIYEASKYVVNDIKPISDVRASAEYRREMSIVLTKDAIIGALNSIGITPS